MISQRVNFVVEHTQDIFSLKVNFDEKETISFYAKRIDHLESTYGKYIKDVVNAHGCTDVQPINGVYQKRFLKNMFKAKHVTDLSEQLKYLKTHEEEKFVKVFVLDIKDAKCHYDNIQEIKDAEKEVEDFFLGKEPKEKSPRKDIFKLMSANNINYFFCEGRLKHYLLKEVFTPEQASYFQETDEGKGIFCQITEIVLNIFKLGYEVNAINNDKLINLLPNDYLILFNNKEKLDIQKNPITMTPLTLFTLYPGHYKELYSIKEKYCESLTNAFKVEHNYDDATHTTAIKLEF